MLYSHSVRRIAADIKTRLNVPSRVIIDVKKLIGPVGLPSDPLHFTQVFDF